MKRSWKWEYWRMERPHPEQRVTALLARKGFGDMRKRYPEDFSMNVSEANSGGH